MSGRPGPSWPGMTLAGAPEPWEDRALCAGAGPDIFYPAKGGSPRRAKMICRACPVRAECLDFALAHSGGGYEVADHGVWGGLSERERKALLREWRAA